MARRIFDETFLRKLDTLVVVSRRVAAGRARGERRSPRKGAGVEFQDYRQYVAGDDLRYVDWNIYGRLDRLLLKLFIEEEDLTVTLLVDGSASMAHGAPDKLVFAMRAAAALGYIDAVIYPEDTRSHIIQSLTMLRNKRQKNPPKKHGNSPL